MKVLLLFLFTLFLHIAEGKKQSYSFKNLEYIKNYDGDTITFNIKKVHPLLGHKISIRVSGIDTPEMRGGDKCEKEKAKIAKNLVRTLLLAANKIELKEAKRGKYFRIVATVLVDGKSIADILIKNKLAVPYDGGTKTHDWSCK